MFKKNDRVIIVNKKAFFPDGYEIGDLATVTKDQTSCSIWVTFDKGFIDNEHGVYASQFELVTTATLQDVVDTIEVFARALLLPRSPAVGQLWRSKRSSYEFYIIGVYDEYVWYKPLGRKQPASLSIATLWNDYQYMNTYNLNIDNV